MPLQYNKKLRARIYMLNYPTDTYESIFNEINNIIHNKNLFQNIQQLKAPDDKTPALYLNILELIKKNFVTDSESALSNTESLENLPESIQKSLIKNAERTLLTRDRSNKKCLAHAFNTFNAFQFSESSLMLAIKMLVFRVHYLLNPNYLESIRQIKQLRSNISILKNKGDIDNPAIYENTRLIITILKDGIYSASDLIILYAFYICITEYIKTAQQNCYDLIGKEKRFFISDFTVLSIRNELQKALQLNQNISIDIDNQNKITIEERQQRPLSLKDLKELSTEGKTARLFCSNCEYTNILYSQGFKRSGLFDGRYYHIDNETISGLHLSIQYANETEESAQLTGMLSDKSLNNLRCMANGTEKHKAPDNYIAVNNGILKINTENPEKSTLLGFSPNLVVVMPIQANYLENFSKDTERYKKIDEYFNCLSGKYNPEYKDHYQEIKTRIIESLSLALSRSQKFKKFFYLHGVADSGKTTLIDSVLGSLFDKTLYFSSKNLDDLDRSKHNFEIATLEHTALLLVDEGASGDSNASVLSKINLDNVGDCIKQLLGGGMIEGARKNIQQKSGFYPECRLYITSNHYIGFEDPQILDKLIYIPLNTKINRPEYKNIFPDFKDQKMKDTLFMYLLTNGFYKCLKNYKATGKYISDSPFIDSIQNKAKKGTSIYAAISDFIEEQNIKANLPFLNYVMITPENMELFTIKHYWNEWHEYNNFLTLKKITRKHFEDVFCELLNIHICRDQKIAGLDKKQITIILPKAFKTYAPYKKECEKQKPSIYKGNKDNNEPFYLI